MCEYCGCQTLTAIHELTREHDVVVDLIVDVRTAAAAPGAPGVTPATAPDVARMADLARRIAAVLGPHTEVEEHGLFLALAPDFPDHVARLEAEHRRIEAVLAEAAGDVPTDPAWPTRLLDVLHVLRRHILKEQDGIFPAALAYLSTADWEAVEAVRSRVGTHLPRATQ